jgi:DDE superfamily endonuclease
MPQKNDEDQIILALKAIKRDPKLSFRAAAKIYSVDPMKLSRRQRGQRPRRDMAANSRKLTDLEESIIVRYVLDLDSKGFPPRYCGVEDMANQILTERDASRVGPRWAANFVKRQPELTARFNRKYDYQRALCDPNSWFTLVQNTKAKYGILDSDTYNFDETGFLMGIIATTMVITSADRRGKPKMRQPGNRDWVTVIQSVNALGWTVPPYIIVKGQYHLLSWYENGQLPKDWRVHTSNNGWTTNEIGLDWIKHFNIHTRPRTIGGYRLLILDGHESHHSTAFELYCKANNVITLCMPAHSSHLLQPLDVGCFGPLKKAYGKQIEDLIRNNITHVTKEDFFSAFYAAHKAAMTEENIKAGFQGAGLIPLDRERVVSRLDIRLRTPTPQTSRPGTAQSWVSKTPNNAREASSQSAFIKGRIACHQNSSPTAIHDAVDQFTKGSMAVMHKMTLMQAEIKQLRKANEMLSKRRRAKRSRLQNGGSLSVQEAEDIRDQIEVEVQVRQEMQASIGRKPRVETRARRCGKCGEAGHNARTCHIVVETTAEDVSE